MSFCHVQVEDIVWTDVDERHEIATEYWISKSKGNRLCNNQSFRYLQTKLKNPSISILKKIIFKCCAKMLSARWGSKLKISQNIEKESGERILSPKKGQRQNLWAPLEEKRFLEFFRYNEFLSRPSRGNPLDGCRRTSWDCNRILSIITTRQIFFREESAESRRNFTNMRLKLLTKNRKSCIAP